MGARALAGRLLALGVLALVPRAGAASPAALDLGAQIEGELRPGEDDEFDLTLEAGDYLRVVVEQDGIDLVVLLSISGQPVAFRDRLNGRSGAEALSFVAVSPGLHRLSLRSLNKDVPPGRYRLTVEARRSATAADRKRAAAEDLLSRATAAEMQATAASRASALGWARRSVELWNDIGDEEEQALALMQLALVHRHRGEHIAAIQAQSRAIGLARAAGNRRLEARMLDRQGLVLSMTGRVTEAVDALRESIAIARDTSDSEVEGIALGDLAFALWRLGDYQEALDCLDQALPIQRRLRDRFDEAWSFNTAGLVHLALGDRETAYRELEAAQRSLKAQGSALGEAATSLNLGFLYFEAGRLEQARKRFDRALELGRSTSERWIEAWAMTHLGHLEVAVGETRAGLEWYERALALVRTVHDRDAEAVVLYWMGEALAVQGAIEPALSVLRRARALGRAVGDRYVEADALSALARTELAAGRLEQAHADIAAALAIVESGRTKLQTGDLRLYYLASNRREYDLEVETLLGLHRRDPAAGHDRRAFESGERARARSLLDSLRAEAASSLADIQGLLDAKTALVSYQSVGAACYAFVVGAASFRIHALNASVAELAERIANYREFLGREDARGAETTGRRLSSDLIEPWRASLPAGTTRLIVAPDGPLHHLPIEALPLPSGRPLLEDFTVSYVASGTVLARLRRPASRVSAGMFLLAEPSPGLVDVREGRASAAARVEDRLDPAPIPFTAAEARALATYAGEGSEMALGATASEARVKAASLERFQVLHFATHGLIGRHAGGSALLLAAGHGEDGLLETREITRLRLASDLVVLAACDTASGPVLAGEGVQGLAQAFLRAGARSVVASLWSVQDERTAALMTSFYERLADGHTSGEALRSAKLDLVRAGVPARYWAPFIVIGDADRTVTLARARGVPRPVLVALALAAALSLGALAVFARRSRRAL